jgi:Pyruvate/2-oxoacid:ferredoxin oxidoreductase delta subunit
VAAASVRNVVNIDEEKCNGCGQCVIACAEGAIKIVDGKARLVSERYCDGLGACLGECPQGAITIEQRPAEEYDVEATREHLASIGRDPNDAHDPAKEGQAHAQQLHGHAHTGCPSAVARAFTPAAGEARRTGQASVLGQWPVQLTLVPPDAPYFQGADLVVTADCVPFAYADYHADLLAGKAVVVGCPKLDDAQFYIDKLATILSTSDIKSITVAIMEVPCCGGMARIAREALAQSGKAMPLEVVTITVRGEKQAPVAV